MEFELFCHEILTMSYPSVIFLIQIQFSYKLEWNNWRNINPLWPFWSNYLRDKIFEFFSVINTVLSIPINALIQVTIPSSWWQTFYLISWLYIKTQHLSKNWNPVYKGMMGLISQSWLFRVLPSLLQWVPVFSLLWQLYECLL